MVLTEIETKVQKEAKKGKKTRNIEENTNSKGVLSPILSDNSSMSQVFTSKISKKSEENYKHGLHRNRAKF